MKPKVLVFIDWYAPGYKAGGPVRSMVNLVDHLRDRIDFHIVTGDTDYTENVPYAGVTPDQWTMLPGGEKVWYASDAGTNRGRWKRILGEAEWDAVYINGIYSYWFSIMPLLLATGRRRIVAVRGMLAEGPMRHGRLKKEYFIRFMRMLGFYRDVEFQATHADEVADIRRWVGVDAVVHLVPNLPRKLAAVSPSMREKKPGELRLVSLARIALEKNTLFAIQCLKEVKGNVIFDLYGPVYDGSYWEQCRRAATALPANVRVEHRGTVEPDRISALLGNYHALFMPSAGENFGHAMIEALGTGLPILISDRTPWRGLEVERAGWDLPLDATAGFSAVIERLCQMTGEEYRQWESGAFSLAQRSLSDPTRIQQAFALFTS